MRAVLTWGLLSALLWFSVLLAVTASATFYPFSKPILSLQIALLEWGPVLGRFAGPLLTLAVVVYIIQSALERHGFEASFDPGAWKIGGSVQAIIAIVIIVAFAVAALAGIGAVSDLKDIALVVVGFYFGTKGKADAADAAERVAGAITGHPPTSAMVPSSSEP